MIMKKKYRINPYHVSPMQSLGYAANMCYVKRLICPKRGLKIKNSAVLSSIIDEKHVPITTINLSLQQVVCKMI